MRNTWAFICAAVVASACAASADISGTVVDDDGQGIAGADVWLVKQDRWPNKYHAIIEHTTTDAAGEFSLSQESPATDGQARLLTVIAHKEGTAIGWQGLLPRIGALRVVCGKAVPFEGRAINDEGQGIKAAVLIDHIAPAMPPGSGFRPACFPPPELARRFAVATSAEGVFVFDCLPQSPRLQFTLRPEGHSPVSVWRELTEPLVVTLGPTGSIEGTISCAEHPEAVAEIGMTASRADEKRRLLWSIEASTDQRGGFVIEGLQPGEYTLRLEPADSEWQAFDKGPLAVQVGETTECALALERTYRLTGQVVDGTSGEPLQGAGVMAIDTPACSSPALITTDEQGRYAVRVLPGTTVVQVLRHPEGYRMVSYEDERATVVVADEDARAPAIRLSKSAVMKGKVVDEEGAPVPDAHVYYAADRDAGAPVAYIVDGRELAVVADDAGAFGITGLPPKQAVVLRARSGERMTPKATKVTVQSPEAVTLVVSPCGVRVMVKAVDEKDAPIAGATVSLQMVPDYAGHGRADPGKTAEDGTFESDLLWPDQTYRLLVSAPGFGQARTGQWKAEPGGWHDFGDVVLTAAGGSVRGRVVDGDGKPVAGARVYNTIDAPEATNTATDAQGAFNLEGLWPGHAIVLAQKDELFGGALLTVGQTDATLTITREPKGVTLGEPGQIPAAVDRERNQQVARELLAEGLELAGADSHHRPRLLSLLAVVSPEEAMGLAAEAGDQAEMMTAFFMATHQTSTDVEEILGRVESIPDDKIRASAYVFVADRLSREDPQGAQELLALALPDIQSVADVGMQAAFTSLAGEVLYRTDPEEAEPVIRRAAELALSLPFVELGGFVRGTVAQAMSRIDLDEALSLIDGMDEDSDVSRHRANIAARIAATQPDEAWTLMQETSDHRRVRGMPRVAYHMASSHPDKAIAMVRELEDNGGQALCLAYIALALRDQDPAKAAELFQEAVAVAREFELSTAQRYVRTGRAVLMGRLAQIAVMIGYPDVERLVWQSISSVCADAAGDGRWRNLSQAVLALAFVRPALVRTIASDAVARGLPWGEEHGELHSLVRAAAAVDADLTAGLLRALPKEAPALGQTDRTAYYTYAIEILTSSPEEAYTTAMTTGGDWVHTESELMD